jgi:hypothetical protein
MWDPFVIHTQKIYGARMSSSPSFFLPLYHLFFFLSLPFGLLQEAVVGGWVLPGGSGGGGDEQAPEWW